ncbi:alpha/beta hydrolase family protein [Amycolatopsis sp. H20-H5]|uniref:alpha/beta hydrolase family protein n=1 Tax=Amycolatopsis sp. H20-H5 TaxID=3046309 RepID=UPI002DBF6C06|nr:lipase [Amycolatopsis sp. H20-H5]MEC3982292.1 lipase [Amycolatopsis sp. H20-H5]
MTSTAKKSLARGVTAAVCAGLMLAAAAVPALAAARPPTGRGELIDATPVQALDAEQLKLLLRGTAFGAEPVRFGVDAYRVTYRTVDVHGRATTASGLIVLPRNGNSPLRLVSYAHGTRSGRAGVASVDPSNMDRGAALLIASAGYAAVAPDYLGLGSGPGFHPYFDSATEATASVDLLRAARKVAARQQRTLDPRVLVTGFSQGGQAAMALGRALQSGTDRWLRLGALAPISGPYDAEHAEIPGALVTGEVAPDVAAFYLAYWTVSGNRLHHLYDEPSEVFRAPYDKTVEALFDGSHSEEQIFPALPGTPQELFTDSYRERLLHPSGAVLEALRASDDTCSNWRPAVPVHLFAASGDTQVNLANTVNCQRDLREHGVRAQVTDLGRIEHFDTLFTGLPRVLDWFSRRS